MLEVWTIDYVFRAFLQSHDLFTIVWLQGCNATSFRICNCESLRDSGLSDCLYNPLVAT